MRKALAIIGVLALILGAFFLGKSVDQSEGESPPETKIEVIKDTLTVNNPVEVVRWRKKVDTMLISIADTVRIRDTLFVEVQREQRRFSDDSVYTAWVSGYRPCLDSIKVTQRNIITTITKREPAKRWSVGAGAVTGAGYVVPLNGSSPSTGIFAGLGIGISYRF